MIVEPPASDVPADKAKWSGKWIGWACNSRVCDTKLAVEKITVEGASIIYAFASERVKPSIGRVNAQFLGDELRAEFPNGLKIAYRMRPEGDLEF